MRIVDQVLLLLAFVCFVSYAFNIPRATQTRVNLLGLGLAAWVAVDFLGVVVP